VKKKLLGATIIHTLFQKDEKNWKYKISASTAKKSTRA